MAARVGVNFGRVVAGSGLYIQLQDKDSTGKRPGQERTEPGLCRMPEHLKKEKNLKKQR